MPDPTPPATPPPPAPAPAPAAPAAAQRTTSLDDHRLGKAAAWYAKNRAWHVFPLWWVEQVGDRHRCACPKQAECGSAGKHPLTPRGVRDATADAKQISAWWKKWPRAHVGVACGPSKLVVVDVDPRNGGDTTLADLEKLHGTLPKTVMALTGGGGQHYLYRRPDTERVRGGILGSGIDLKADGGYVVVDPSGHVSGRRYAWEITSRPDEVEVAPLPDWIAAGLDTRSHAAAAGAAPLTGYLGAAFAAAGWLGRVLGADRIAALCPWEAEHTSGTRYDGGTVVFGPRPASNGSAAGILGHFHCSHSHCAGRTFEEVIAALPAAARAEAKRNLGLPKGWAPLPPATPPPAPPPGDSAPDDGWQHQLVFRGDPPKLVSASGNAALLLANLDEWSGVFALDQMAGRVRVRRAPPPVVGFAPPAVGAATADHDAVYVQQWLLRRRDLKLGTQQVHEAIATAAATHAFHPLRDELRTLRWDGTARVDTWLSSYLGAPPSEYATVVGRWWLVSAIARVMRPGCQVDHMLVLEGPQGGGKTSAVRILAGEYLLPALPDLRNEREAAARLAGRWIVEVGELDAFRGASGTRIKDFLTRVEDVYRPAYGRNERVVPRQCVFVGTTNETEWSDDTTGARRFWPVRCTRIDIDGIARDRDQLLAEAVMLYDTNEPWWPTSDVSQVLAPEQESRRAPDAWEPGVMLWLTGKPEVTVGEVLGEALNIERRDWSRPAQMRVGAILRRAGYARRRVMGGGRRAYLYSRAPDTAAPESGEDSW